MADNFKMMALNAPAHCMVSMNFRFHVPMPIDEFLTNVDIPRIFSAASYWQGAKFSFRVRGVNHDGYFIIQDFNIPINLLHFNVKHVSFALMSEYVRVTAWTFGGAPLVHSMSVWFL
jgi:hypothetical protein